MHARGQVGMRACRVCDLCAPSFFWVWRVDIFDAHRHPRRPDRPSHQRVSRVSHVSSVPGVRSSFPSGPYFPFLTYTRAGRWQLWHARLRAHLDTHTHMCETRHTCDLRRATCISVSLRSLQSHAPYEYPLVRPCPSPCVVLHLVRRECSYCKI